jgi:hypothetical protein
MNNHLSAPIDGQMILVIEALTGKGSLSMRSEPISPVLALMLASRMANSPTPAQIQPATRERLDHYPAMPSTGSLIHFLLPQPANQTWRYPLVSQRN